MKFGVIDIGSNSIRLVIFKQGRNQSFKEIENFKVVSRLSTHLDEEGRLSEEGIHVLCETLENFREIARHHQMSELKVVATAAIRQSRNQDQILDAVAEKTGLKMEILSEYQEAYYGFLAVINSTSLENGISIDVGGGSTEVTLFSDRKLVHYHSFPFGAVSLKEKFIQNDVPTQEKLRRLSAYLSEQFQQLDWVQGKRLPVVGIGGSARNLVKIHQVMNRYPLGGLHQYEMETGEMFRLIERISSLSIEQLRELEGLSKDRADIIIPSAKIFQALMECVLSPTFLLSNKGLREGVYFDGLFREQEQKMIPDVSEQSLKGVAAAYDISLEPVQEEVKRVALMLFQECEKHNGFSLSDDDRKDLEQAAYVFHLGRFIDLNASGQHTFYLLTNQNLDGFSHKERLKLALLASFSSKSIFKKYIKDFKDWFTKDEQQKIVFLGTLLKLAYSLNHTNRRIVENIQMTVSNRHIHVRILCNKEWLAESYKAERQVKHLEKATKKKVILEFSK
ncbi:exopolyphosphatase [Ammoniphilus sp. 3BR4]|uniref:exopolyphosphatase n=1 Tax=Ammoniphilus sp. 3BR4 TaxID=3158265 RepID=UPI003467B788